MNPMSSVTQHYETLLAPIYLWMAGGMAHATKLGASDVAEFLDTRGYAVDLGAGFGMHTIALAQHSYRVLAVDTSEHLLAELRQKCSGLNVNAVEDDLLNFSQHMSEQADLILCMGDTLTHLQDEEQIATLMRLVSRALRPGGHFVATFRDYRHLPSAASRFIPVRSDADRIHTCFLEDAGKHVRVHDILHERSEEVWKMKVSSYTKLRLSPDAAVEAAKAAGMRCSLTEGPRGMVKLRTEA